MKTNLHVIRKKTFIISFIAIIIFLLFLFFQIKNQNYKKELDCFKQANEFMKNNKNDNFNIKYHNKLKKCFIIGRIKKSDSEIYYYILSLYENMFYAAFKKTDNPDGRVFNGKYFIKDINNVDDYKKLIKKYFNLQIYN